MRKEEKHGQYGQKSPGKSSGQWGAEEARLRKKPTVDFCIFDMPPCHHGLLQLIYEYAAGQFQRDHLR